MISVRPHDDGNCGDVNKEFCKTDFGDSAINARPIPRESGRKTRERNPLQQTCEIRFESWPFI